MKNKNSFSIKEQAIIILGMLLGLLLSHAVLFLTFCYFVGHSPETYTHFLIFTTSSLALFILIVVTALIKIKFDEKTLYHEAPEDVLITNLEKDRNY